MCKCTECKKNNTSSCLITGMSEEDKKSTLNCIHFEKIATCERVCEVYSRVVGYYRPTSNWNKGKKEEFKMRKTFTLGD